MRFYRRSLLASSIAGVAGLAAACGGAPSGGGSGAAALVYGSDGEITTLGVDGKGRRQLTKSATGSLARDPAWTPDGARIAYAFTPPLPAVRGPGGLLPLPVTDVYTMNADGSDQKVLVAHDAPGVGIESPVWAPDGKSLFVTYTALLVESNIVRDQTVEIARVTPGGARQTLIPNAITAALSPDGKRLAFVSVGVDGQQLAIADVDGQNQKVLVPFGRMDGVASPRFSPDGRQVVFSAVAPMSPVLVPTTPPSRAAASSASPAASQAAPTASAARPSTPAGRASNASGSSGSSGFDALAFGRRLLRTAGLLPAAAHAHGLPMDVFAIAAEGGTPKRLTQLGEDSPSAVFSPDGKRIAILSGGGIYVMDADGSNLASIDQRGGHGGIDWRRA
jgi:Tol biopolymer transport system component